VSGVDLASITAVDGQWAEATFVPPNERNDAQKAALALSDKLVADLKAADILMISTPVHNFSVPSPLKAWVDQICRVGETFRYGEQGPVGMLRDIPAFICIASGGTEVGSPFDHCGAYLQQILTFAGIKRISIFAAHGLSVRGPASIEDALAAIAAHDFTV
jgi:FMN-dependent NADH-azoreductase